MDWDEPDNDERAGSVADYVLDFASKRYHGPEEIDVIVQDMITNLGHFLDRVDDHRVLTSRGEECEINPAYCQPGGGDYDFTAVLDAAAGNYDAEFSEELEDVT